MDFVARYLGMPPVAVYEVATFYAMYNLEPTGTYKLTLCTNLPCGLQARSMPRITCAASCGSTSTRPRRRPLHAQGRRMFGACAMAPVLLVNNKKMHDYMSNEKLDRLLDELGRK